MNLKDLEHTDQKTSGVQHPQELDYILIRSRLLDGERIVMVFEEKVLREIREEFPDIAVYTPSEVKDLYKYRDDSEFIKRVHLVKKGVDGQIVPSKGKGGDN